MMKKPLIRRALLTNLLFGAGSSAADEGDALKFPPPQFDAGQPLMQALRERKSVREFSVEKLPLQVLSNLLWAAFGVNRPETGGRTAPSVHDWQEIDIYVATADGVLRFDAKAHGLEPVMQQDDRALTGNQALVRDAPVNLIYVADFARMNSDMRPEEKQIAASADAGFIAENVYLYCAATDLATVVRGSIDRDALAKVMRLKSNQWIVLAQSVGFPKR